MCSFTVNTVTRPRRLASQGTLISPTAFSKQRLCYYSGCGLSRSLLSKSTRPQIPSMASLSHHTLSLPPRLRQQKQATGKESDTSIIVAAARPLSLLLGPASRSAVQTTSMAEKLACVALRHSACPMAQRARLADSRGKISPFPSPCLAVRMATLGKSGLRLCSSKYYNTCIWGSVAMYVV